MNVRVVLFRRNATLAKPSSFYAFAITTQTRLGRPKQAWADSRQQKRIDMNDIRPLFTLGRKYRLKPSAELLTLATKQGVQLVEPWTVEQPP